MKAVCDRAVGPPRVSLPGNTTTTFEPMPCTCWVMLAVAPVPMAIKATTAPTPMMMPSMVSAERSLLAASARRAMRKFSGKFMVCLSRRRSGRRLFGQRLLAGARRPGGQWVFDHFVAHDAAVGDADHPGCVAGDKRIVRHVNH